MADTSAPAKGLGGQLARKVGPFPLGVWLAGGVAAVWYLRKKQAGAGSPAAQQSQTGYGTDPAGNTGYIDPSTGYVYGSAEDIAALQSQGLVGQNSYNTGGAGDTSGTGASGSSTPDATVTGTGGSPSPGSNVAVGSAGGTSSTGAATAATNQSGTSTQTVTTSGGAGTKVTTPGAAAPQNNSWRYPAPTGLQAYAVSDSGFRLQWNAVQGPNGQKPSSYAVALWQENGKKVSQHNVNTTSSIEYGAGGTGLHPGWQYKVLVWANGGPLAPPGAQTTVTIKQKGQA